MSAIMSTVTPPVTLHFLLPAQQLVPASTYFWHFQNRLIMPLRGARAPPQKSKSQICEPPSLGPQVTGKQNAFLRYLSPGTKGLLFSTSRFWQPQHLSFVTTCVAAASHSYQRWIT